MRILIICKSLTSSLGGIQTHVRYLCYHLAQMQQDVVLLTDQAVESDPVLSSCTTLRIIRLPFFPGYRFPRIRKTIDDLAFNLKVCWWLLHHHREIDVVHVHGRNGIFSAMFRFLFSKPLVATFHGITTEEFQHTFRRKPPTLDDKLHRWLFHRFEKNLYHQADALIAVSKYLALGLEAQFGPPKQEIQIVSNGITLQSQQIPPHKPPWVLFIGRLVINKGIQHLPKLAEHLHPDIKVRIIGTGEEEKWLKDYLSVLGWADTFEFVGPIPNWQIKHWLDQAFALVMLSEYEPQGIVALEAMERGVPVVAPRVGGLEETILHGKTGFLALPDNHAELATYLNSLYQFPDMQQCMSKQASNWVKQQYDWRLITQQTLAIYQSVSHE